MLTEKEFDTYLDENYPWWEHFGAVVPPSKILKELDPTAYDQAKLDYEDDLGDEE